MHSGWRGLEAGVVAAGVAAVRALGRGPVRALVGPCVSAAHYEFGPADLERLAASVGPEVVGRTVAGRPALDLRAGIHAALRALGVDEVHDDARCTVADLAPEPSAACQAALAPFGEAVQYQPVDVTRLDSLDALVAAAEARFGPIHVLFNNAAVFDLAPLLESDEASYERLFAVNVKGLFFAMQKVLARMVAQGTRGSVINMSSQAGRRGEALVSHYCATKAAVISYTQSAALAMAPHHIRVNAIAPGVVDTPMWAQVDRLFAQAEGLPIGEKKRRVGLAVPLGYMGRPADIAGPDRKSTRLNSSHSQQSRMPSSA